MKDQYTWILLINYRTLAVVISTGPPDISMTIIGVVFEIAPLIAWINLSWLPGKEISIRSWPSLNNHRMVNMDTWIITHNYYLMTLSLIFMEFRPMTNAVDLCFTEVRTFTCIIIRQLIETHYYHVHSTSTWCKLSEHTIYSRSGYYYGMPHWLAMFSPHTKLAL